MSDTKEKIKLDRAMEDSNGNMVAYEDQPKFKCPCGFKGRVFDLVAPDDDKDPIECPQCHKGAWEWI